MTASASVVEALAKYDADAALCPVRQNDVRSVKECRKCGATQSDRCGQDHPYPVIEALRASIATPHPAEQDAREAVARIVEDAAREGIRNYCLDRTDFTAAPFVRRILAITQAAPDGWVLVPVEPTHEMIEAGYQPWLNRGNRKGPSVVRGVYLAMLSASPAPQAYGWRPIETAPKDGTLIIAAHSNYADGIMDCVLWSGGRWETQEGIGYMAGRFTHWRPLPAPPAQEAGG